MFAKSRTSEKETRAFCSCVVWRRANDDDKDVDVSASLTLQKLASDTLGGEVGSAERDEESARTERLKEEDRAEWEHLEMEKCNKMPHAEREAEGKKIKWREGREGGVRWSDITAGSHRPVLHCRYQNKTRQGGGGGGGGIGKKGSNRRRKERKEGMTHEREKQQLIFNLSPDSMSLQTHMKLNVSHERETEDLYPHWKENQSAQEEYCYVFVILLFEWILVFLCSTHVTATQFCQQGNK